VKRIKVGIIGQGRSGRNIHGAHLVTDTDRYEIAMVADALESRRKRAAEEYGCEVCEDHHDLFKRRDLDLIVNSTPSHMHVPITLEILKAGFNALCEKPFASRARDVDRMIEAAAKAGKVLAVYQQSRFAPAFTQIRNIIDSGVLGRIVQVSISYSGFGRRWDWQTLTSWNGGNLLNTGPHPLDQALQFFGDGMPKVLCYMDRANTMGDAEDHVKLLLGGEGHPVIDLEISSCCMYPCFTYNVYGTLGGLKGSASRLEWKYFLPSEAPPQKLTTAPIERPDGIPAYCNEELKWHTGEWTFVPPPPAAIASQAAPGKALPQASSDVFAYMARRYYDMLYQTLTTGAPLLVTPEQVRRQIAVIEECQKQNPQIYPKKQRTGKG
jgi:scyllo-inositol 2-dehydrogenase (NADP+)